MRKIVIIILIFIIAVIGYFAIFEGLSVFSIQIVSVTKIKDKSDKLNSNLEKLSTLTSVDYPKAITDLNDTTKQLLIEKDNYNDIVNFSSTDNVNTATQLENYEVEYLWAKIGNHATKKGVTLKLDITTSSSQTPNQYDLKFTANGQYVAISDFVAAIENDSNLNFSIENFNLVPSTDTGNLQATFKVKDIAIKIDRLTTGTTVPTTTGTNADNAANEITNGIANDINFSDSTMNTSNNTTTTNNNTR